MINLLALDIAGRASGACFGPGNRVPQFRTLRQELGGMQFGRTGTIFREWMIRLIKAERIEAVAFESPWVPSGNRPGSRNTGTRIPRILIGLAWEAEQIADEFNLKTYEAPPSTCRKTFVGHGRPNQPKATVEQMCAWLKWPARNDHEADAGAIWAHHQAVLDPKFSYMSTELFARTR